MDEPPGEQQNLTAVMQKRIDGLIWGYLIRANYTRTAEVLAEESTGVKSSQIRSGNAILVKINDTVHDNNLEHIVEMYTNYGRQDLAPEFLEFGFQLRELVNQYSTMTAIGANRGLETQKRMYPPKNPRHRERAVARTLGKESTAPLVNKKLLSKQPIASSSSSHTNLHSNYVPNPYVPPPNAMHMSQPFQYPQSQEFVYPPNTMGEPQVMNNAGPSMHLQPQQSLQPGSSQYAYQNNQPHHQDNSMDYDQTNSQLHNVSIDEGGSSKRKQVHPHSFSERLVNTLVSTAERSKHNLQQTDMAMAGEDSFLEYFDVDNLSSHVHQVADQLAESQDFDQFLTMMNDNNPIESSENIFTAQEEEVTSMDMEEQLPPIEPTTSTANLDTIPTTFEEIHHQEEPVPEPREPTPPPPPPTVPPTVSPTPVDTELPESTEEQPPAYHSAASLIQQPVRGNRPKKPAKSLSERVGKAFVFESQNVPQREPSVESCRSSTETADSQETTTTAITTPTTSKAKNEMAKTISDLFSDDNSDNFHSSDTSFKKKDKSNERKSRKEKEKNRDRRSPEGSSRDRDRDRDRSININKDKEHKSTSRRPEDRTRRIDDDRMSRKASTSDEEHRRRPSLTYREERDKIKEKERDKERERERQRRDDEKNRKEEGIRRQREAEKQRRDDAMRKREDEKRQDHRDQRDRSRRDREREESRDSRVEREDRHRHHEKETSHYEVPEPCASEVVVETSTASEPSPVAHTAREEVHEEYVPPKLEAPRKRIEISIRKKTDEKTNEPRHRDDSKKSRKPNVSSSPMDLLDKIEKDFDNLKKPDGHRSPSPEMGFLNSRKLAPSTKIPKKTTYEPAFVKPHVDIDNTRSPDVRHPTAPKVAPSKSYTMSSGVKPSKNTPNLLLGCTMSDARLGVMFESAATKRKNKEKEKDKLDSSYASSSSESEVRKRPAPCEDFSKLLNDSPVKAPPTNPFDKKKIKLDLNNISSIINKVHSNNTGS